MARIVVLGSANAVPSQDQANSHLAIIGERRGVLVDCPVAALTRLQLADVKLDLLSDLILTHFHPDHVAGLPAFLMSLWLLGRRRPLSIHGLAYSVDRAQAMMNLFDWDKWPGMYPIQFHRIPVAEGAQVLRADEFQIQASPTRHMLPSVALRVQSPAPVRSAVYSSDTEPCDEVIRLAQAAHLLIHEATGAGPGHSSPEDAGDVARRAGVERLLLIHYNLRETSEGDLLAAASSRYSGPVDLARDLMTLPL